MIWEETIMTWKFRPFPRVNISVQIIFIIRTKNRGNPLFSRHYDQNGVNIGQIIFIMNNLKADQNCNLACGTKSVVSKRNKIHLSRKFIITCLKWSFGPLSKCSKAQFWSRFEIRLWVKIACCQSNPTGDNKLLENIFSCCNQTSADWSTVRILSGITVRRLSVKIKFNVEIRTLENPPDWEFQILTDRYRTVNLDRIRIALSAGVWLCNMVSSKHWTPCKTGCTFPMFIWPASAWGSI